MNNHARLALCVLALSSVASGCRNPSPAPLNGPVDGGSPVVAHHEPAPDASRPQGHDAATATPQTPDAGSSQRATGPELAAFGTKEAFDAYARNLSTVTKEAERRGFGFGSVRHGSMAALAGAPEMANTAGAMGPGTPAGTSITNNQEQGVDEGDIVKSVGDYLVVLRRGRLFSIKLSSGALSAVSHVNAYAPGAKPASWYDEMLVHDDTILVVGYSYEGGVTEINRFTMDTAGVMTYRDTMFLRSNDYYSSRNYASRVVGDQLVMYTPVPIFSGYDPQGKTELPAVRSSPNGAWTSIIDYAHLFRPVQPVGYPTLHTVVFCDLKSPTMSCRAEGILGPASRNFYVSSKGVYVWVSAERNTLLNREFFDAAVRGDLPRVGTDAGGIASALRPTEAQGNAAVYQLPLDGSTPGVVGVKGSPVDQFSFRDTGNELQVFVTAEGMGEGMWGAEVHQGDAALLRVPLSQFSMTMSDLPASAYKNLPRVEGGSGMLQNRFVGDTLLYGTGSTWWNSASKGTGAVFVHTISTGTDLTLQLPHGVDRIEPLGSNAVVVGTDGKSLHYTSLSLVGAPSIADHYEQTDASQGETRSHGFFFRADDDHTGVIGLPVRQGGEEGVGQLDTGSAGVSFLRVTDLKFKDLGTLRASVRVDNQDHCVASCTDWYGNARPIFYQGRAIALMGYEMVEGRISATAVTESTRINYLSR